VPLELEYEEETVHEDVAPHLHANTEEKKKKKKKKSNKKYIYRGIKRG
jgi:hypothetical protein